MLMAPSMTVAALVKLTISLSETGIKSTKCEVQLQQNSGEWHQCCSAYYLYLKVAFWHWQEKLKEKNNNNQPV